MLLVNPPDEGKVVGLADPAVSEEVGEVDVSIVLPCLDERATVGLCVSEALSAFAGREERVEVVVVDNGCRDDSAEVAVAHGGRVVAEPRRGYGAALRTGIQAARGRYVVMADCDHTYDLTQAPAFVDALRGGHEFVMGSRRKGRIEPGAMPFLHRYLGNPVLSWILNRLFGSRFSDVHCGMRAFTASAFLRIDARARGMEFASEMAIKAARAGLSTTEVPVTLRTSGVRRVPHLRTFADGWRHVRLMLLYSPSSLFLVPGTTLLGLGLGLMVLVSFGRVDVAGIGLDVHTMILGAMLTILGFNVLSLGVYAKTYAHVEHYQPNGPVLLYLQRVFSLELALRLGLLLVLVGLGFGIHVVQQWIAHGGELTQHLQIRPALWCLLFVVLGWQVVFSSLFLSMLRGPTD